MCSIFGPIMESYEGDLTDIVRAGTVTSSSSDYWQFSSSDSLTNSSAVMEEPIIRGSFGDPFSNMRDPFLHHHHHIPADSNSHFDTTNNSAEVLTTITSGAIQEAAGVGIGGTATSPVLGHKILEDDMRRSCGNIFSNLIQISPNTKLPVSPCDSPATTAIKPLPNTSKDCRLQISSSRNPGLKRRKSLVKKVVCIPAPAAANSRSSGEVVPSDLWAWRKYGQKPIKGSPYPRGYYRCSNSKGCSARKQVERSRTDPNMLVITYTSEHNHPWPTQRNALAGSTRSHTSKINENSETTNHSQQGTNTTIKPKELDLEQQKRNNNDNNVFPVVVGNSAKSACVKQEMGEGKGEKKQLDDEIMDDGDQFFAELGEIEADYPPNRLFTQGFNNASADHDHDEHTESKALDPFHDLFDWSSADNTLFQQPKRGL